MAVKRVVCWLVFWGCEVENSDMLFEKIVFNFFTCGAHFMPTVEALCFGVVCQSVRA